LKGGGAEAAKTVGTDNEFEWLKAILDRVTNDSVRELEPRWIVGVVKDAKYDSLREDMYPTAFFPNPANAAGWRQLVQL